MDSFSVFLYAAIACAALMGYVTGYREGRRRLRAMIRQRLEFVGLLSTPSSLNISSFVEKDDREPGESWQLCVIHLTDGSSVIGRHYDASEPQPLPPLRPGLGPTSHQAEQVQQYRQALERLAACA